LSWIPRTGDLVGVKRLGIQGIVLEVRELHFLSSPSGAKDGSACVLVEGAQRMYSWCDLYHIPTDEDEDA